ncbi:MAG: hypothetical protein ACTTJJ_09715 [Prevotella fusca]|uniref:hypothetical protein n=1 Tax=Prevotella fusca TaxID=589436 RepID=UPI003F9EEFFB
MTDENKELEKLKLLMRAIRSVDSSEPPEWEQELREGAWLILHNEPGTEREEWKQELLSLYPTEVVDTFGTDPARAYAAMDDWWERETYEDENTGLCETYQGWSLIFANEKSVMVFDELSRLKLKLSRLGLSKKLE